MIVWTARSAADQASRLTGAYDTGRNEIVVLAAPIVTRS